MTDNNRYYSNHKILSLIKKNETQKKILEKQLLEGRKYVNALESPTQYNKVQELESKLNILKKSLENISNANSVSNIMEKSLVNIIILFQSLLDLNLQLRQPGISNQDVIATTDTVNSLEQEIESSLKLYKFNNKKLFYCEDEKVCELSKVLRWNISSNNLESNWISLSKPKIILKGLEKNFLLKVDDSDNLSYSLNSESVGETRVKQLEYNIKVINNDISKLNEYLSELQIFKNSIKIKFNSLKMLYDSDLNTLTKIISVDKDDSLLKIDMLDSQIKSARKLFLN